MLLSTLFEDFSAHLEIDKVINPDAETADSYKRFAERCPKRAKAPKKKPKENLADSHKSNNRGNHTENLQNLQRRKIKLKNLFLFYEKRFCLLLLFLYGSSEHLRKMALLKAVQRASLLLSS